jgi:hypothetical protein
MKILYCHPTGETGRKDCIAFVDVEVSKDLRLYGLRLVRKPDGAHFLYAPRAGQRRVATFSKPMAQALTDMAVEAFEVTR